MNYTCRKEKHVETLEFLLETLAEREGEKWERCAGLIAYNIIDGLSYYDGCEDRIREAIGVYAKQHAKEALLLADHVMQMSEVWQLEADAVVKLEKVWVPLLPTCYAAALPWNRIALQKMVREWQTRGWFRESHVQCAC